MDIQQRQIARFGTLLLYCLFSSPLLAQSAADLDKANQLNDQIIQQFQQQQKALQTQRENQQPHISIELKKPQSPTKSVESADTLCFQIDRIDLKGITLLDKKTVLALKKPFIKQCLSIVKINNLVKSITLKYVNLGYVTSRAYIPQQDLSKGVLHITVIEGEVEAFNQQQAPSIYLANVFPNVQGKPLNLRDIEQGIEQINRLSVNHVSMNLLPGKAIGATIVQLNNRLSELWQGQLSIDNSGQKNTGEYQGKLFLSFDNAFNLNDYLSLTIQNDVLNTQSTGNSNNVSLRYEIPYGYWLFSLDANWYDYSNLVEGETANFESTGSSQAQTLKAKYIWFRDQSQKTDVSVQLNRKRNNNYIEDVLLDTSSRILTILTLSLNQQRFYKGNQSLQWSVALKHGLPYFGAEGSTEGDSEDLAFTVLSASMNYSTPFKLISYPVSYATQWSMQHSDDDLYGSEKISIGSQYTVRGFKNDSLSSRTGMYWRNDMSYNIAINGEVINTISPFIGLDVGSIKNIEQNEVQHISGIALGAKLHGKQLNAEITISYAQKRLSTFNDDKTHIHFSLGYSL